ncbi:amidohydrolase family protein [Gordonia sp. SID5947]|uniref:amidohydrolase family protein n=1 Tax=Gordonia sp. SID5947 TaxID=2690315 RepID=UPI001371E0BE|nr:amidohydrolase family protein [Gordonia sp. SID5947]MYR07984.1 amidohydrolase family protein [Gordonia sp. SID5947]
MDTRYEGPEPLIGTNLDHADLLRHAGTQAQQRGFDDVFIVDADFHHTERRSWAEILEYVESDVLQHFLKAGGRGQMWIPGLPDGGVIQEVAGRIHPAQSWADSRNELTASQRDVQLCREAMDSMGSNFLSFFPGWLLDLGTFGYDLEVPLARAWARWATERVLPADPRIVTLLPLPLGSPDEALKLVEEFADKPGVQGFMVTSLRYDPLYTKPYAKLWRAIEERGKLLGFHASFTTQDRPVRQLNKFISVHSVGFPLFQIIQTTNWVINGMPERYPNLKILMIEGGLAWVPFLMQRLDHEYLMRQSEAPLLKRLPSEYMREFFYTTQPLEAANLDYLEMTFDMINAKTQVLYASDWPHWDWDPPSRIWDLPFLDEAEKRNILGYNASRVFNLPIPDTMTQPPAPDSVGLSTKG